MEPIDFGFRISDCGIRIYNQGDRSQNPEFRRKQIKIEFLSATDYFLDALCAMLYAKSQIPPFLSNFVATTV
jgi:hypothetical protein